MLDGGRGLAAPGSGASRRSVAVTGVPPSVPLIEPLLPGVTVPMKASVLPSTQLISPVRRGWSSVAPSRRRSLPLSVACGFEMLTNCPDC